MDTAILILTGMAIGTGISLFVAIYYMRKFSKTFFHPHTRLTAKELKDMGVELPDGCPDAVRPMFITDVGLAIRWCGSLVGFISYKIHGKKGYDPNEMKYDGLRTNKPMKVFIDYEYRIDDDEVWVSVPEKDFKNLVRAAGDMG